MASVHLLPNPGAASTRKQGHLEAGKRRLEEFRKKKARKASFSDQLPSNDAELPDRFSNFGSIDQYTLKRFANNIIEPSNLGVQGSKKGTSQIPGVVSANGIHNVTGDTDDINSTPTGFIYEGDGIFGSSGHSEVQNSYGDIERGRSDLLDSKKPDQVSVRPHTDQVPIQATLMTEIDIANRKTIPQTDAHFNGSGASDNRNYSFNHSDNSSFTKLFDDHKEQMIGVAINTSRKSFFNENDENQIKSEKVDQELYADNTRGKMSDSINHRFYNENSISISDRSSMDFNQGFKGSSLLQPSFPPKNQGNGLGRSRPSFLDSISVSRISSVTDLHVNSGEADPTASSTNVLDKEVELMTSQKPLVKIDKQETSDDRLGNETTDLKVSSVKDDDFSTLEQHIEDLTQEKFSLQRALDTSRSLAESLASENSSLMESYNQQGKVVNQLRYEMEQLQDEIRTQLMALESLKLEYSNVQLECNAADERAKILASEVINLEEKALRLRSNELKLEKLLENSNAETTIYKQKLYGLEKENHDFRSTLEALREENKLLQSKLWKASITEKAMDRSDLPVSVKRDACTSTDDLGGNDEVDETESSFLRTPAYDQASAPILVDGAMTTFLQDITGSIIDPETDGAIPHDQLRMIDNINLLVSELMLEKQVMMQKLAVEVQLNSKLEHFNKELSLKLETQTQRFELLAAQKMVIENAPIRHADSEKIIEGTPFTDEGDEVVERVLGWIMKLFPGGPGKRRTSRLL